MNKGPGLTWPPAWQKFTQLLFEESYYSPPLPLGILAPEKTMRQSILETGSLQKEKVALVSEALQAR